VEPGSKTPNPGKEQTAVPVGKAGDRGEKDDANDLLFTPQIGGAGGSGFFLRLHKEWA